MALLQQDGTLLVICRTRNANASQTDIRSNKKAKFIVDKSALVSKELNRLARLQDRLDMRKALRKLKGA